MELKEFLIRGKYSGLYYMDNRDTVISPLKARVFTEETFSQSMSHSDGYERVPVPLTHPARLLEATKKLKIDRYVVEELPSACGDVFRMTPFWVVHFESNFGYSQFLMKGGGWTRNRDSTRQFETRETALAGLQAVLDKEAAEAAAAKAAQEAKEAEEAEAARAAEAERVRLEQLEAARIETKVRERVNAKLNAVAEVMDRRVAAARRVQQLYVANCETFKSAALQEELAGELASWVRGERYTTL